MDGGDLGGEQDKVGNWGEKNNLSNLKWGRGNYYLAAKAKLTGHMIAVFPLFGGNDLAREWGEKNFFRSADVGGDH